MLNPLHLIKKVPVKDFIELEGCCCFSREARIEMSKRHNITDRGDCFTYTDNDGVEFLCAIEDDTVHVYHREKHIYNQYNKKEERRGIICKSKEVAKEIKARIMWGKW